MTSAHTNSDGAGWSASGHADPATHQRILETWAAINAECADALAKHDGRPRKIFCPIHEADGREHLTPSCEIRVNARSKPYVRCWSGNSCDSDEILKALYAHGAIPKPRIIIEYIYDDEQSVDLFHHVRWEPKNFTFRRNGSMKAKCMEGARYVLYGLRSLLTISPGSCWIGIPEGERDTETLWSQGMAATCDARGAGNIKADVMGPVKDHRIAVFPDADEAGVRHGRLVAKLALEAGAAEVRIIPPLPNAKDVTEFVEHGGTREQLDALIEAAKPVTLEELADVVTPGDGPYVENAEGGYSLRVDKDVALPLCNFSVHIDEDIHRNDGAEVAIHHKLTVKHGGTVSTITVAADEFSSLGWVGTKLGSGPNVYAGNGNKDRVRDAIQRFSTDKIRRDVFTYTGWKEIDGANVYLTGGGGIGAAAEVEVALPAKLSKYSLPLHVSPEDQIDGVRASLRILDADAQRHHGYGLLSLIYRSAIGRCNCSGHLTGDTGALKSTRLELMMRHWGAGFTAGVPDGGFLSWSSTVNALEYETFATKDCVTPIDEFCPPSTSTLEKFKQDDIASRLLRAQADGMGRGRLTREADGLRPEYCPRGLIVSTGESIPGSHAKGDPASLRARILIIKIRKSDAHKELMADCTIDGALGKYANAMGGYITWLAPRLDQIQAEMMGARFIRLRTKVTNALPGCHEKTVSMIAALYLSFGYFLKYALEIGALSQSEHDAHVENAWHDLLLLAGEQAQQGHSPTERFLQLIRTAISTERAYLHEQMDIQPDGTIVRRPEGVAAPWGSSQPLTAKLIGFFKGDDLYIEPDVAYKVASEISPLPVDIETLKARLKEEGKLASFDKGRYTVRRARHRGAPKVPVLHLKSKTLAGE